MQRGRESFSIIAIVSQVLRGEKNAIRNVIRVIQKIIALHYRFIICNRAFKTKLFRQQLYS